jgi:hypothetical protein
MLLKQTNEEGSWSLSKFHLLNQVFGFFLGWYYQWSTSIHVNLVQQYEGKHAVHYWVEIAQEEDYTVGMKGGWMLFSGIGHRKFSLQLQVSNWFPTSSQTASKCISLSICTTVKWHSLWRVFLLMQMISNVWTGTVLVICHIIEQSRHFTWFLQNTDPDARASQFPMVDSQRVHKIVIRAFSEHMHIWSVDQAMNTNTIVTN